MTQQEVDRKISELRGWRVEKSNLRSRNTTDFLNCVVSPSGLVFEPGYSSSIGAMQQYYPSWYSDINWPTLLRELPFPELFKTHIGWKCFVAQSFRGTGESPGEAVCIAWLKWKGISV